MTASNSYIQIQFQDGPVREVGVNGCQVDDVLVVLLAKMDDFQDAFPCTENEEVIRALRSAQSWLAKRTENRIAQHVEGYNKPHIS